MKNSVLGALLLLTTVALVAASCGGGDSSGAIEVEDARYRLAKSDLGAGYMSISNTTDTDVTFEGASSEGVGRIELHESLVGNDGTMTMQARPDGFVIAAGATITLEPGGKHLMIFDPLGIDDLTVSLDFGDETVEVLAVYDAEASAAVTTDDVVDMDADAMANTDS
jgi:copper(I)-binding protein